VKQIVMAVTGASGAPYARRLAQCIVQADAHLHLVMSPHGAYILKDELGLADVTPTALLGRPADNVTLHRHRDQTACIASGSFPTDGMVVCPCSSNTLAAVAAGTAENLVTRAALVTLKEARRLVLVPREMPLGQIELANMLRLSQAGALLCPACPGFYNKPQSVGELIDFVVARVLDLLSVPHDLRVRWTPPADAIDLQ
jgi:4-hydroxy-3-polyprenylbenzoate decarboxylase